MSVQSYIATFFTHFAAVSFSRELRKLGIEAQLSPVPRSLSSSCGTCARFSTDQDVPEMSADELEQLMRVDGVNFISVIDNR